MHHRSAEPGHDLCLHRGGIWVGEQREVGAALHHDLVRSRDGGRGIVAVLGGTSTSASPTTTRVGAPIRSSSSDSIAANLVQVVLHAGSPMLIVRDDAGHRQDDIAFVLVCHDFGGELRSAPPGVPCTNKTRGPDPVRPISMGPFSVSMVCTHALSNLELVCSV